MTTLFGFSVLRFLAPALLALPLAACMGGPAAPNDRFADAPAGPAGDAAPVQALAPQTLAPGTCGLFLFELRAPNSFILFEDETARRVRLVQDGAVLELGVAPQGGAGVPGEALRRVYLDPERNVTYTLTGRIGAETASGQRLERVILRARTLDGVETVTPLGGVRRCMERRPVGPSPR